MIECCHENICEFLGMKKVDTNQIEVLSRVYPEKTDDAQWQRRIYITGGYKALYGLFEALQEILTTKHHEAEVDDLKDYQDIVTKIQIRLQDWES